MPRSAPPADPRRPAAAAFAVLLTVAAVAVVVAPTAVRPAGAQVGGAQRIAAVVNDDVITTADLNARLNLVLATSGLPANEQTRRRLLQQVLRGYVDEKLQLQEARRLRLEVSDAEVDKALETIAQRNRLDLPSFKRALAERNIDEAVLRAQIRGQIAWAKVIGRELRPRVAVTDEQVGIALKEATSGQGDVEVALAEILLPVDSPGQERQVLREAADLVATLRGGADFAALARQVSVAASAQDGGDLGWVRPSMVLPDLRGRLAVLPVGGVSDPIASPVGVHIFKVRDRRDPRQPAPPPRAAGPPPPPPPQPQAVKRFVPTKVSLAQVILPLAPNAKESELKAATKRAAELSPKFKGCKDVEAYAQRTGSEGSGALGWLDVKDLPEVLRRLVAELEPQRISPPFRGPYGVQMLMVCDRKGREETVMVKAPAPRPRPQPVAEPPPPPPPPAPPTREEMRRRLEDEQLQRLATRYLRELRKDAFIDVRLGGA